MSATEENDNHRARLAEFEVDETVIRRALSELSARGADHAELYFQSRRHRSLSLADGIVSAASTSVDRGVGLRCVIGDQVGYAYTEELVPEAIFGAAKTAAAIANQGPAVAPQAFVYATHPTVYPTAAPFDAVDVETKMAWIAKAEARARRESTIEKVRVSWFDSEETVLIATLDGQIHYDHRPMLRFFVGCTAKRGSERQSNSSNVAARRDPSWLGETEVFSVVDQALDRTLRLFGAQRPPAGELPVVLDRGASGILLHEAIGHGMEADFNRKKTSIYSDKIGQKIAGDFVTIVDDGTLAHQRGALNVDDEGGAAERTVLVENGILRSYLHDRISAQHYGVATTGSGRRQSFRHAVMPRMRCTFMENGPHDRDEIISSVKKGIIAETFTNGQVQIGAGDFTFYIKNGWLIEDGKVTAPIKDCNIIGNGPEALRQVSMAANDLTLDTGGWTCGKEGQSVPVSQGLPTIKVDALTVGGMGK